MTHPKGARTALQAGLSAAWVAAACWALPAQALEYQRAYAEPGSGASVSPASYETPNIPDPTQPTTAIAGTAFAQTSLVSVNAHTSDTTHWILGPYAAATSRVSFGLMGTGLQTVTFTLKASGHWTRDVSTSYNLSARFVGEVTSHDGPTSGLYGNVVDVNCLGCGGRLAEDGLTYVDAGSSTGTTALPDALTGTWLLTTTVQAGLANAAQLRLDVDGGAGFTDWATFLQVAEIRDGRGQTLGFTPGTDGNWWLTASANSPMAAVPEPETWAMTLLGLGLVGTMARRRARRSA